MQRNFTDLEDLRLLHRGNKILSNLFSNSVQSIRQFSRNSAEAKAAYRFLQNDRVSEEDIIMNMSHNCRAASLNKYVVCIEDTTEINLSSHSRRINKDDFIGTTTTGKDKGLGFFIHPSFVIDAQSCIPYGYADVKIWNRPLEFTSKLDRGYQKLPIEQKESYKWIESSNYTKAALKNTVAGMVIVQDREGDIYEQFATIPDAGTDLLIRSKSDRKLSNGKRLCHCLQNVAEQGSYTIEVEGSLAKKKVKRTATIGIKYSQVEICKPHNPTTNLPQQLSLHYIEATETGYDGADKISWRLLTSIPVENISIAKLCIEWYSWRWMIEEVFKTLKKEGFNIESSELEYASSIRKLSLMILEVILKLFLLRLSYAEPELMITAEACFNKEEIEILEHTNSFVEGKTIKQKNPFLPNSLARQAWTIARLGGWKGYESYKNPGITTLWTGLKKFNAIAEGWLIKQFVSTR